MRKHALLEIVFIYAKAIVIVGVDVNLNVALNVGTYSSSLLPLIDYVKTGESTFMTRQNNRTLKD